MLAVQGPLRAGDRPGDLRRSAARAHDRRDRGAWPAPRCSCAAPATPARTASSCSAAPSDAAALWDELVRRGAVPGRARPRATRCAWRSCFHLYGNDLTRRSRPDRGGARLVLQGGHRLHRRARPCARCASAGPAEKLVAFAIDGPGIARQGNPVAGRRRGHQRHALALPRDRASAWPTCRPSAPPSAPRLEIDVRGKMRPAVVKDKPLYRKGS